MHEVASSHTELGNSARAALLAYCLFSTIGLFSHGLVLPQIEHAYGATPHAELLTQLIGAVASFAFAAVRRRADRTARLPSAPD